MADRELTHPRLRRLRHGHAHAAGYLRPDPAHALGAQAPFVPHHVRDCLGSGVAAAADRRGRRLPQRQPQGAGDLRQEHHFLLRRARAGGRGQLHLHEVVQPDLRRLPRHQEGSQAGAEHLAADRARRHSRRQRVHQHQRPGLGRAAHLQPGTDDSFAGGALDQRRRQRRTPPGLRSWAGK